MAGHICRDSLQVDENKGVLYRSLAQNPTNDAAFVVRTTAAPGAMKDALSFAARSADSSEAIYGSPPGDPYKSLTNPHRLPYRKSPFIEVLALKGLHSYGSLPGS